MWKNTSFCNRSFSFNSSLMQDLSIVGRTTIYISSELGTEMFVSVLLQAGELRITALSPQIVNYFFFFHFNR